MQDLLIGASAERSAILYPAAVHLALVVFLYAWLSIERLAHARSGRTPLDQLVTPGADQGRAARIAANLSNQFEAPVLFHILVLTLWMTASFSAFDVLLCWVFIAGRLAHTGVQVFSTNVLARGLVFSINFSALCLLWVFFLAQAF